MAHRICKIDPDRFCYVCGKYGYHKLVVNKLVPFKEFYEQFYHMPVTDLDKPWTPNCVCQTCYHRLMDWGAGRRDGATSFNRPRIWSEPSNHFDDCYFCMVDINHFHKRKRKGGDNIDYPNIPSSQAPRFEVDVTHRSEQKQMSEVPIEASSQESTSSCFEPETSERNTLSSGGIKIHRPNQLELNDLIRDLGLTIEKSELLTSRLKSWNLVDDDVRVTHQRKRHESFAKFFTATDHLTYCNDIFGLFDAMDVEYNPTEWRLFIDSSKSSLKGVLLHNGNVLPSIPIAYGAHTTENYDNVKNMLELVHYEVHKWLVIGDFKMIGFLTGLQGGYTKHMCFLCLWDSRADDVHYAQKTWPERQEPVVGENNIENQPLVDKSQILLPPLHIKLGLMKQFVKALDYEGDTFSFLRTMFPNITEAKLKGGVFVGPQIRRVMKSDIKNVMNRDEREAWEAYESICSEFLGNKRDPEAKKMVDNLIEKFQQLGCRMSLKMHFLFSHFDFFKQNLGHYSEEHGERFHQDMKNIEKRYVGRWNEAMMGEYIWGLVRESENVHKRKNRSSVHL